jgi:hypothetical protein
MQLLRLLGVESGIGPAGRQLGAAVRRSDGVFGVAGRSGPPSRSPPRRTARNRTFPRPDTVGCTSARRGPCATPDVLRLPPPADPAVRKNDAHATLQKQHPRVEVVLPLRVVGRVKADPKPLAELFRQVNANRRFRSGGLFEFSCHASIQLSSLLSLRIRDEPRPRDSLRRPGVFHLCPGARKAVSRLESAGFLPDAALGIERPTSLARRVSCLSPLKPPIDPGSLRGSEP